MPNRPFSPKRCFRYVWDCGLTKDKIIEINAMVQSTQWFLLNARLNTDMIRKRAAVLAEEMLFCYFITHLHMQIPPKYKRKKNQREINRQQTTAFNSTAHHTTEDLAFPTLPVCVSPWLEAVSVLSGVSQCRQMRSHYASLPQG